MAQSVPHEQRQITRLLTTIATPPQQQPSLGRYIRNVYLGSMNFVFSDQMLLLLMKHTRLLEKITIGENVEATTDASFKELPRYCPHLTSLHLYNCQITYRSIMALAQHSNQLTKLVLIDCPKLPTNTLSFLARGCPLEKLVFRRDNDLGSDYDSDSNEGMRYIEEEMEESYRESEAITVDLVGLHHLTKLEFFEPTLGTLQHVVNTNRRLGTYCWPHLVELCLEDCKFITQDGIIRFLQAYSPLKRLTLIYSIFDDDVLDAIGVSQPYLVFMKVSQSLISGDGIRRLIRRCHQLTWFDIYASEGLTLWDFPEAAPVDLDTEGGGEPRLYYLDAETINKICHGGNYVMVGWSNGLSLLGSLVL